MQNKEGIYTIPWNENASEIAKETGTIRFYFMSGEKQSWSSSAGTKFGDSCLIAFPNGELMLIDGGMPNYGKTLMENLKLLGVTKLDYVVLSHMHDDHYGGLYYYSSSVFANFEIGTFLWNGIYNASKSVQERFNSALKKYNINAKIVSKGDSFYVGEVLIEIFNPSAEEIGGEYVETAMNNASIVMKFTYDEFTALFSGDLYSDGEYNVVSSVDDGVLDVDLVKANHHGRNTSNSKEWVSATTPEIVVASSGNPIDETPYGWYSKNGARVFNDNLDGYIRVISDGYNTNVSRSRARTTTYFSNFDSIAEQVNPQ